MGKFSGLLMLSDLDKTFFAEGTQIPPKNIEAVNYFINNGGLFTLATGRGAVAAKKISAGIPMNAPAVLFNGALLYDLNNDVQIEKHGIEKDNVKYLIKDIMRHYPDVMITVFRDDAMYCVSEVCDDGICRELKNDPVFCSVDDIPFPWFKVLCLHEDSVLRNLHNFIMQYNYEELEYVRSTSEILEIVGRGNDKGFGLKNLAGHFGIDIKNTIAVGDYFNDEPMMKVAGRVFLPENAAEELKKYGTVVCNNKQGCIADVVNILDSEYRKEIDR